MNDICGIFHVNGRPVDPQQLQKTLAAGAPQSPAQSRTFTKGPIGLGRKALRVHRAPTQARLPLVHDEQSLALTADARIDNRNELIRRLSSQRRQTAEARADAELILNAYAAWGHDCVHYLRGSFVFAIWDGVKRELFLARDAIGERSACYSWDESRFAFASHPSQLLALPGVEPSVNRLAVVDLLQMRVSSHERTCFEPLSYIPPGHSMTVSHRGLRKWRYWDGSRSPKVRYRDERDYGAHFRELLTRSVRARIPEGTPVGLSLSGGLDSTLLASVTAPLVSELNLPQARLKTFSYVFDELRSCDEREYIAPVVEACHLDSTLLVCDDEWSLRDLKTWPVEYDRIWWNPFARLPRTIQNAAQAAGCGLLMDGQFGDALFPRRPGRVERQLGRLLPDSLLMSGARGAALFIVRHLRSAKCAFRNPSALHPGLHPQLRAQALRAKRRPAHAQGSLDPCWPIGMGEARRVAHRRGLRVESPYFDRAIVEFMLGLPREQLHRPNRNRWVQRNAMLGHLPEKIAERKGKTWVVPLMNKGLRDRERDTFRRILGQGRTVAQNLIDGDWLRRATHDDAALLENVETLWLVCALELWLERVAIESKLKTHAPAAQPLVSL